MSDLARLAFAAVGGTVHFPVAGIADGCKLAGCALIGGETAEMPGMYAAGDYDLAGFCVGIVEKSQILDGSKVSVGDVILGLSSSGPHSNGYSLIRKVLASDDDARIGGRPAREVLLEPTRIYVKSVLALMQQVSVKGLSHITGGGISENLPRVIPADLHAVVDTSSWQPGPVFDWLAETGNIDAVEMRRTFNCGVGMIAVVSPSDLDNGLSILEGLGESAWHIGAIEQGAGPVEFV